MMKEIKRYVSDGISIFILGCTEKMINKVRRCRFSGRYFPRVIDMLQILRNDGNVNNWSGGGYYSQCGQDMFINLLFGNKKEGFFLDIGGNDPVKINNTYYFEKNGWNGLAFEPLEKYQVKWKEERTTPCLSIALGDTEKDVVFREMDKDYLSGIKDDGYDEIKRKVSDGQVNIVNETIVKQRMLKDVLAERNIKEVDFVSLDVEGAELNVLQGIDFQQVTIKCFAIENVGDMKTIYKIRKYLYDKGYWIIARLTHDDVFVNRKYFYQKW